MIIVLSVLCINALSSMLPATAAEETPAQWIPEKTTK